MIFYSVIISHIFKLQILKIQITMIWKLWKLSSNDHFSEAEQPSRRKQEYDLKVYVNQAAETTENFSRGKNIQTK